MSLSTCEKCGGHIPLGPDSSNRCEKCGEHVFSAFISRDDHNESILALCRERDRYRKALEAIRAKLSCTLVPREKWVKELHGELFCLAHFELEQTQSRPSDSQSSGTPGTTTHRPARGSAVKNPGGHKRTEC